MSLKQDFGANLRQHRKAKGLTQAELADQIDLSIEMISKIERGEAAPSFTTVESLSVALDVPEVAFFGIGLMTIPEGERGRLLAAINRTLSRMNERELARAEKMLAALSN